MPQGWALPAALIYTAPLTAWATGEGAEGARAPFGQLLGQLEAEGKHPGRPLTLQLILLQNWES